MNPIFPEPEILLDPGDTPEIPLPKGGTGLTLQVILHVIALARIVILNAGNWPNDRTCDGLLYESKTPAFGQRSTRSTVQAWFPDHVWSVDLTVVPSTDGLWVPWPPNAMPQEHPYCFHVLNVIDHFSRRYMGFAVFQKNPTANEVVTAMKRISSGNSVAPTYFVLDRGTQFDCKTFRNWSQSKGIKIRFGKLGEHGSIARVERFHRSMKDECTRRIIVPTSQSEFEHELSLWGTWYNSYRPHMSLKGRTPDEVFYKKRAANTLPRIEPRVGLKHASPCAAPRTMMAGKAGRKVNVQISFLEGRQHLPILQVLRE